MTLQSIQPANLWDSSPYLFSQVVQATARQRLVFIAGQIALASDGSLVGQDDVDAQLRQVFANLRVAVGSAGGTLNDIASLTVYVKDIAHHSNYLKVLAEDFSGWRPTETLLQVGALGLPDLLVEIQAVAVLP